MKLPQASLLGKPPAHFSKDIVTKFQCSPIEGKTIGKSFSFSAVTGTFDVIGRYRTISKNLLTSRCMQITITNLSFGQPYLGSFCSY